jgi:mannose-6-phosphate isomerase
LAEKLHAERPHVYKDANHKPEMAVALSVFEALSGFVTVPELAAALTAVPELRATVGETVASDFTAAAAAVRFLRLSASEGFIQKESSA